MNRNKMLSGFLRGRYYKKYLYTQRAGLKGV